MTANNNIPEDFAQKRRWIKDESRLWQKAGIINDDQYDEILKRYGFRKKKKNTDANNTKSIINFQFILTVLGIILVILGIVTFLTSTWMVMPKILKILIIFLSIINLYGLSYYLVYENDKYKKIGKGIVFLTIVLYGVSIFLLINIFNINISFHIPFFIWAIGSLIISIFEKDEFIFNFSSLLFVLWSSVAALTGSNLHYFYLLIVASLFGLSYLFKFKSNVLINLLGFFIWLNISCVNENYIPISLVYFITLYLALNSFSYKSLSRKTRKTYTDMLQIIILALSCIFSFTFYGNGPLLPIFPNSFMFLIIFSVATFLSIYNITKAVKTSNKLELYTNSSFVFIITSLLLCLIPFGAVESTKIFILSLIYNLFYLAILICIIKYGLDKSKKNIWILGTLFFIAVAVMRMIDPNWSIVAKTIFFILLGGGIIGYNAFMLFLKTKLVPKLLLTAGKEVAEPNVAKK